MTRDEALQTLRINIEMRAGKPLTTPEHKEAYELASRAGSEAWHNRVFTAQGFLEGYEQGVRDVADIADSVIRQIETDTGYKDNFQGDAVTTVRNKAIALLEKRA